MSDKVEVLAYNPDWIKDFESEAKLINQALGDNCIAIHHIGSTAVPLLAAKPIIDILPVVKDIMTVDKATDAMEQAGFEGKGEAGMLFRRFFHKRGAIACNVHIYEKDHAEVQRYLKFRDWMRTHEEDRKAYSNLKKNLSKKYPNDISQYVFGKDAFVALIDSKTGATGCRIVQALTPREWETARHFRQHYFFDKASIVDPYTWTFTHHEHIHLILYEASVIIGYAHIQLWPNARAALRIIVIDEPYRNKKLGSQFLIDVERWLKQKGMLTLHVQSSPQAYQFYLQHHYQRMPFNDPDDKTVHPDEIEVGKMLT
ncbi:MAG: GNAT family N-acetyltransferase [Gammaproteobacteria bacterium]|jgi:GrpB-like predicted nucleotidyltransferase (UPF0157 family)|nr:GNAT family N-acetyltransferase [Gammaproteobacteria bacterium]